MTPSVHNKAESESISSSTASIRADGPYAADDFGDHSVARRRMCWIIDELLIVKNTLNALWAF